MTLELSCTFWEGPDPDTMPCSPRTGDSGPCAAPRSSERDDPALTLLIDLDRCTDLNIVLRYLVTPMSNTPVSVRVEKRKRGAVSKRRWSRNETRGLDFWSNLWAMKTELGGL